MPAIVVVCSSCKHKMRFGEDKAGRKAKCPKCGKPVVVAAPEENGEEEVKDVAPAPQAKPEPKGDELGAYGVTDVVNPDEKKDDEDQKPDKKKKKKAPKLKRKIKALPDSDLWDKVRGGLIFIFIGACLWGTAHLLQGLYVALGMVDYTEYTRMLANELAQRRDPLPANGEFWDINPLNCLLGMIAGIGFLGLAKTCLILAAVLRLAAPLVACIGYLMCLPIPNRYGTSFQITALLGLGAWNLLMVLGLMVLPVLGAYNYILIPLLTPEVVLTEYNMERSIPLNVMWMASPFWECLLNLFLQFLYYLEPIVGASFLWSIGMSIREKRIEDNASSLVQVGLGTFFILLSFHMLSITGTTPVAVYVMRVLYILWYAFLLLFLLSYAALLLKAREVLYLKINPPNETDE